MCSMLKIQIFMQIKINAKKETKLTMIVGGQSRELYIFLSTF